MWLFYYFNFKKNYDAFKSNSPCMLLNKNVNFNKNEAESKIENPRGTLCFSPCMLLNKNVNFNKNETESKKENPRGTLCFSSYKNRKLKVKLLRVGAREKKKRAFFVPFILSEGNFFNICVLSQCIVY